MGDQDRLWQRLKGRYLRQVRKALARTRHPRRREIIEEVESHLDQRYAHLDQQQRTREGLVAIIEQMGPTTDFAELLEPPPMAGAGPRRGRLKYLCSAGLAAATVLAVVLIAVALSQERVTYVIGFKAAAPFHPKTAAELLAAFNEKCPRSIPTHHFRTKVEGGELIGLICVDTEPAKDKLIEILRQPDPLELVSVCAVNEEDFKAHCALGQTSLAPAGAAPTYIVTFQAVAPFAPATARELLDAFNANHPRGVRTHHYRTQVQEGRLIGQICVDTEAGKDAVVSMLKAGGKLQLVKAELADERSLESLYRLGQPGLQDAGGAPNSASRTRPSHVISEPRARTCTISRTGQWPAGDCSLGGTVSRRVWPTQIDHAAVCLTCPPCFYPGTFSRTEAMLVTFDEAAVLRGLDITARRTGGLVLEGAVTAGERGEPVAEALVSLFRRDMPFDLFFTYTDGQGRYRLGNLGDGTFLVHVDAVHKGYIKTRKLVTLGPAPVRLDFALNQGVDVRGVFVDEHHQPYRGSPGFGHATNSKAGTGGAASNFAYGNKFAPDHLRTGTTLFYEEGQGDAADTMMVFPDETFFLLPAVAPGEITLQFTPRGRGQRAQAIFYEGRDIQRTGLTVKPGPEIRDIEFVVATGGSQ